MCANIENEKFASRQQPECCVTRNENELNKIILKNKKTLQDKLTNTQNEENNISTKHHFGFVTKSTQTGDHCPANSKECKCEDKRRRTDGIMQASGTAAYRNQKEIRGMSSVENQTVHTSSNSSTELFGNEPSQEILETTYSYANNESSEEPNLRDNDVLPRNEFISTQDETGPELVLISDIRGSERKPECCRHSKRNSKEYNHLYEKEKEEEESSNVGNENNVLYKTPGEEYIFSNQTEKVGSTRSREEAQRTVNALRDDLIDAKDHKIHTKETSELDVATLPELSEKLQDCCKLTNTSSGKKHVVDINKSSQYNSNVLRRCCEIDESSTQHIRKKPLVIEIPDKTLFKTNDEKQDQHTGAFRYFDISSLRNQDDQIESGDFKSLTKSAEVPQCCKETSNFRVEEKVRHQPEMSNKKTSTDSNGFSTEIEPDFLIDKTQPSEEMIGNQSVEPTGDKMNRSEYATNDEISTDRISSPETLDEFEQRDFHGKNETFENDYILPGDNEGSKHEISPPPPQDLIKLPKCCQRKVYSEQGLIIEEVPNVDSIQPLRATQREFEYTTNPKHHNMNTSFSQNRKADDLGTNLNSSKNRTEQNKKFEEWIPQTKNIDETDLFNKPESEIRQWILNHGGETYSNNPSVRGRAGHLNIDIDNDVMKTESSKGKYDSQLIADESFMGKESNLQSFVSPKETEIYKRHGHILEEENISKKKPLSVANDDGRKLKDTYENIQNKSHAFNSTSEYSKRNTPKISSEKYSKTDGIEEYRQETPSLPDGMKIDKKNKESKPRSLPDCCASKKSSHGNRETATEFYKKNEHLNNFEALECVERKDARESELKKSTFKNFPRSNHDNLYESSLPENYIHIITTELINLLDLIKENESSYRKFNERDNFVRKESNDDKPEYRKICQSILNNISNLPNTLPSMDKIIIKVEEIAETMEHLKSTIENLTVIFENNHSQTEILKNQEVIRFELTKLNSNNDIKMRRLNELCTKLHIFENGVCRCSEIRRQENKIGCQPMTGCTCRHKKTTASTKSGVETITPEENVGHKKTYTVQTCLQSDIPVYRYLNRFSKIEYISYVSKNLLSNPIRSINANSKMTDKEKKIENKKAGLKKKFQQYFQLVQLEKENESHQCFDLGQEMSDEHMFCSVQNKSSRLEPAHEIDQLSFVLLPFNRNLREASTEASTSFGIPNDSPLSNCERTEDYEILYRAILKWKRSFFFMKKLKDQCIVKYK